jgi:tRNA A-37 threonylcarbamoyl transferase component Bud32
MEGITFDYIISEQTHYGVIWKGKYKNEECAIKVVLLNTGVHYNKKNSKYYNHDVEISKSKGKSCFKDDDRIPFLHSKYRKRKSMSKENFVHEIKMLKEVSKNGLAPDLFHCWVNRKSYKAHYGFIVMRYMKYSVKDILLRRNLTGKEEAYILSKIRKLHDCGIRHGDLKPSNIGVNLDSLGHINHIRMIDWAKGDYTKDHSKFKYDIDTFYSHIKKNIDERK